jgi:hypothetical protein
MGEAETLSAENGIGTGGRLHAVGEAPAQRRPLDWPEGAVPVPKIKTASKTGHSTADWREILSSSVEIAGIASISAGFAWYSPGIGLISAGVGLLAVGVVTGIPRSNKKADPR